MRKKFLIIIIALLLFLITVSFITLLKDKDSKVSMERIDHSVKSESGKIIALIYFDKPSFTENSQSMIKIKKYFESEYEEWLNGNPSAINFYGDLSISKFFNQLKNMQSAYDESTLVKHPLEYSVNTELVFFSNDILSFRQYIHWYSGGPSDTYVIGSTFNLKTGELIPFTEFNDINASAFKKNLSAFLNKREIEGTFDNYGINDKFIYEFNEHEWNMSYEYYYDGDFICLILNHIGIHSGYIVKWNGKVDNEFKATIWSYGKENKAYYECPL